MQRFAVALLIFSSIAVGGCGASGLATLAGAGAGASSLGESINSRRSTTSSSQMVAFRPEGDWVAVSISTGGDTDFVNVDRLMGVSQGIADAWIETRFKRYQDRGPGSAVKRNYIRTITRELVDCDRIAFRILSAQFFDGDGVLVGGINEATARTVSDWTSPPERSWGDATLVGICKRLKKSPADLN
jgi:hypothetical protein